MADNKKSLENSEMDKVNGGYVDGSRIKTEYEPYDKPSYPVHCPKCNSKNIWYISSLFDISELEQYWCRDCDNKFDYDDLTYYGSSETW